MNKAICSIMFGLALAGCSADPSFTVYGSPDLEGAQPLLPVGVGSPTSLLVRQYAIWLSLSADCSDPILVQDYGATAAEFDLFGQNVVLFEGSPPDGTYHCMIMKQEDTMVFTVDETAADAHAACELDTPYTFDVYRDDNVEVDGYHMDLDGNPIPPHGTVADPVADTVYFFATTDLDAPSGVSVNQLLPLTEPLVVPGQVTFVISFQDKVVTMDGACWLEVPSLAFR